MRKILHLLRSVAPQHQAVHAPNASAGPTHPSLPLPASLQGTACIDQEAVAHLRHVGAGAGPRGGGGAGDQAAELCARDRQVARLRLPYRCGCNTCAGLVRAPRPRAVRSPAPTLASAPPAPQARWRPTTPRPPRWTRWRSAMRPRRGSSPCLTWSRSSPASAGRRVGLSCSVEGLKGGRQRECIAGPGTRPVLARAGCLPPRIERIGSLPRACLCLLRAAHSPRPPALLACLSV